MTEQPPSPSDEPNVPDRRAQAYVVPFVVFMLFLGVPDLLTSVGLLPDTTNVSLQSADTETPPAADVNLDEATPAADNSDQAWYVSEPKLWLFPVQTLVTAVLLAWYWKEYQFRPHTGWLLASAAGVLGIVVWLAPGFLFRSLELSEGWWKYVGFADRSDGFDPSAVSAYGPGWYWATVLFRFARLVLVVPLVEEIFWRGFLMRFLADMDGDYWQVPFGTFHKLSLVVVTALFVLAHAPIDYLGATIYGLLAYGVAVKTKSLSACVLMHAVANLLLGLYIMMTQQWGYW